MTDREKVVIGLKCLITDDVPCDGCPYYGSGYCVKNIASDALAMLKAQEEKIRQLESMNVSASGNGTAIGVVKGGLVIQKGQNNKHIVNNGTMTMTFGK